MNMKLNLLYLAVTSLSIATAQNPLDTYITGNPTFVTIGTTANKVLAPKDLDFHPTRQDEIWVLNRGTGTSATSSGGSVVIFEKQNETTYKSKYKVDKSYTHFMNYSNAIAMGAMSTVPNGSGSNTGGSNIQMAISCEGTNGGDNFMGPTLWPTDTTIYCKRNQTNSLLGSHSDMLHQSPKSAGIAHDDANIYWVTDGNAKNIVKYDFASPHCYGCDNHSDGKIYRYSDVTFTYVSGVPSHLVLDKATGWLYIADTGGKRILRMNTKTGSDGGSLTATNESLASYRKMTGATKEVFVSTGLVQPSGIDFVNGRLIVSDYSTGEIIIYDATGSTGVELKRFKSGSGVAGITGVKVSFDNYIWYVDNKANTLVKVIPGSTTNIGEAGDSNIFRVFPNPASDKVFINLYGITGNEPVAMKINDMQGREIYSENISRINSGSNQIEFDSNRFAPGVYFVNLIIGNQSRFQKLIIQ